MHDTVQRYLRGKRADHALFDNAIDIFVFGKEDMQTDTTGFAGLRNRWDFLKMEYDRLNILSKSVQVRKELNIKLFKKLNGNKLSPLQAIKNGVYGTPITARYTPKTRGWNKPECGVISPRAPEFASEFAPEFSLEADLVSIN